MTKEAPKEQDESVQTPIQSILAVFKCLEDMIVVIIGTAKYSLYKGR